MQEEEAIVADTDANESDELIALCCQESFYFFVREFWEEIINEELVANWHMKYLCDELQEMAERVFRREKKAYDAIVNVPPGSSKSTICSEMFPAWCWTRDPTLRFLCGSYTDAISNDLAEKCRAIIVSAKYQKLFPEVRLISTNVTHLLNSRRGERYTTSTGGSATGLHAHFIIIDDPLNPKKAASDVERVTANEWMSGTLSSRKVNKAVTPTLLIMQRLHEEDCTGHLLERWRKVRHICLPAEISDLVQPPECRDHYVDGLLDPVRLDPEVLADAKKDLGSYGYSGQFDQNPAPADGGILKRAWFDYIDAAEYEKIKRFIPINIYVDGAYTEDTQNDPSGFMAAGEYNGRLYIQMAVCKWLEMPDFVRYVPEFAGLNGLIPTRGKVKIEPKANGLSAVQTLQRTHRNMPVMSYVFPKNARVSAQDSKVTRAHGVSSFIEAGRVVLVRGPWNTELLDQCAAFPNAAHDEYVDLLIMACCDAFLRVRKPVIGIHN